MIKKNKLLIIFLLISILFMFTMVSNKTNESFINLRDNFENMRNKNSCNTCKVRNKD